MTPPTRRETVPPNAAANAFMDRLHPALAILVMASAPASAAASDGAGPRTARHTAKVTASHAASGRGVSIPFADWYASCHPRKRGGYRCQVSSRSGQCSGEMKLARSGKPYAVRVPCP